jgi:SAM-dependent methyltransferase
LSLELAFRGHRVTGVDFAPSMIAQARKKAAERQTTIRYEEADAEQLPFAAASFDIAVSRTSCGHCRTRSGRWTSGFGCCGRAGGSSSSIDSQADVSASPESLDNARRSPEYAAIDLVAVEEQRMEEEELERRIRRRSAVWGDVPR